MKKLLIILIFVLLLSGCNFVLPDDIQFTNLIQELDTPQKICDYMSDNFTYKLNILLPIDPYQLYLSKKGDCDDFAKFAMFMADYHGYETWLVKISFSNYFYDHYIVIYLENGLYNFSDNYLYQPVNCISIVDAIIIDIQWICNFYGYIFSSYTIYDNNIIEQTTK